MSAPSLPMQFGVPLNQLSFLFFGCLGVAIWLVYVFCQKRFAERSVTESSDWIYQLLPRQLATREEYSKGFLIYFATLAAFVVLLSLLGPKNLEPLGIKLPEAAGYVIVPLAIAFILIGALPTVPGLTLIEKSLREYAHKRAYIPDAARATANRLAAADFDFTSYQGEALESPEMRGVEPADFIRPRHSLGHSWARLCCLVYVQKSYRMSGLTEPLDASLLRDYEKDLDFIESKKQSMEAEVAAYRAAKARDPFYTNDDLRRAIRDNLYKLYILLGCAVRLKQQHYEDLDLALGQFGFRSGRNAQREADNTGDLQLIGLTVVAVSITFIGLDAWGLGQLGLWTTSPMYPQKVLQPFLDTASTLVPNAAAIMLADVVRKRAIKKGWWFSTSGAKRRGNIANYIRVAMASGVAGYLGLILWGLALQVPTLDGFIIDAPFALLAMVTGGFYVYHVDNAEISSRPSRSWELGSQTVMAGVCGLIAACATGEFIFGSAGMVIDKIVLATVVNAVFGFAFAWYIPQAAAATRNPLSAASEERVGALETAAKARLGEDEGAVWLNETHPALGNLSPPAAAVVSVEGFESAIGLLQGPRELPA